MLMDVLYNPIFSIRFKQEEDDQGYWTQSFLDMLYQTIGGGYEIDLA